MFSAEWLALREPADARARSVRVVEAVADVLPRGRPLRALDLAAGTGSNVRYLAGRLPSPQCWLLVDHAENLLAEARASVPCAVSTRTADLARLSDHHDLFSDRDLVTASALLDLVSEQWVHEMLSVCAAARTALLFALSYDGRIECTPRDIEDDAVRELVNRHQRTNKGFGPAVGPIASDVVARALGAAGYDVIRDASDWVVLPDEHRLQREIIEGWADAATESAPSDAESISRWRARRITYLNQTRSCLVVGHEDIGAWLR